MVRTRRLSAAVVLVASCCACVVGFTVHAQYPMPGYFADIKEWAASGRIADTFTPLAFPLFAGPAFRLTGAAGIVWLQALLYIALVLVAIGILRRLHLPETWAALGALLIALHPEYLLSISKIWDVDLSGFLLLLFVLVCLRIQQRAGGVGTWIALGVLAGAAVFCRPNYALMLPAVLYALGTSPGATIRRAVRAIAISVPVAALVFAALGVLSHGSAFVPRNGPYNLFAGNNPYARTALLEKLNAEPSIPQAFAAEYPSPRPDTGSPDFFYGRALEPFYKHAAAEFAVHHPVQEMELIAIKCVTLFRPDTKVHGLGSFNGLIKLILALPAPLLVLMLVATRRHGMNAGERLLFVVYAAYVLPFLITNSDPRFRIPLDALVLLHLVRRLYLVVQARESESPRAAGALANVTI